MTPIERVLAALEVKGFKAKKSGSGWTARCPAHDDRRPSLCIGVGDIGQVLLKCQAGCPTEMVTAELGLMMPDLFSGNGKNSLKIGAIYPYRDEHGTILYEVVRLEPKDFRFRRPNCRGGWIWSLKGVRRVLYRLPELVAAKPSETICVCEGEKDVEKLRALGCAATTNPGGAGKWRQEFNKYLSEHPVAMLADNDVPGRKHAEQVAGSLFGCAGSVKILELPGLPEHGDVSVWLDAGGTAEVLRRLIEQTPEWKPRALAQTQKSDDSEAIKVFHLTDLGNAHRLVDWHGQDLRYVGKLRHWRVWDGTRWADDVTGEVLRRAKMSIAHLYSESAELDEEGRKALAKHALRSENVQRIGGMVKLAESEPQIASRPEDFDCDLYLLNVQNGTLNLKTGELRPHRRDELITKLAPVKYDPDATCPTFEALLIRVFDGHVDLIRWLQKAVGYSLTGLTIEQVLFIMWGSGANGKSTLLNIISEVLGDYATTAAPEVFLAHRKDSHPTAIADLEGVRLVSSVEVDQGARLAENLVKQLTGGDPAKARRMRTDYSQFIPRFKLFLACNHKPTIRGTDLAIWRRIRLIPFNVTIPPKEQDKHFLDKLLPERSGILKWALDGCLAWQKDGLGEPPEVIEATEAYRAEMDVIAAFIADECVLSPTAHTTKDELYNAFKRWAEANGEVSLAKISKRKLRGLLIEREGIDEDRTGDDRYWIGIGLADQARDV